MNLSKQGAFKFLQRKYFELQLWLYKNHMLHLSDLTLPDFLCIGAQKAGTTWLHKNLRYHPEIYLPDFKEIHFFNGGYKNHGLKWYSQLFEEKGSRIAGDITPAYSTLDKNKIEILHRILPNAKIILILRNPIERAWSAAKMHLCTLKGKDYSNVNRDEFISHFNSAHSLNRGDYINIYKKI